MIELVGLDKSYGVRRILTAASLTVGSGESLALIGANGSGKTTTLRCAVGLAHPDAGRILIDGTNVSERPRDARARVSYLAQRTDFPSTLTVREILQVVADLRPTTARAIDREISLCGLDRVAGRTVAALSGGERQRVAMAALFIPDATTYLLDEPTMSLDPIGIRMLVERVAALRDEGRAVLFTTHVTAELDGLATHVAMLRGGRITPVTQDIEQGQRHISVAVERPGDWIAPAMHAGATRAWLGRGRLHAIVTDATVSTVLSQLDYEGARIGGFRSESSLAAALDRLNEEDHQDEAEPAHRIDRSAAVGQLWRGSSWAGADSAGPR